MAVLDDVKAALADADSPENRRRFRGEDAIEEFQTGWLRELVAEVDRLQKEWDAMGKMCGEAVEAHTKAEEENKRLACENETLREALKRYGAHDDGCPEQGYNKRKFCT